MVCDGLPELHKKLLATVARYDMVAPGDRVLVAVSGGQDSVALLHALWSLKDTLGVELQAAHLHHGIRGTEADEDLEMVQELCGVLGVELTVGRVSVPELAERNRVSLERAGREARREFLASVARAHSCERIALGHTATDRAETVLMNILRGSGLRGLRGIAPVAGKVIRPLIDVTREETAAYCRSQGLVPRVDGTNLDPAYCLRNRVRLELFPLLEREYSGGVVRSLLRLAEIAEGELQWTEPMVQEALRAALRHQEVGLALDLGKLAELPAGLLRRVLLAAAQVACGEGPGEVDAEHVEALEALVRRGRTGARLAFPGGLWAERGYGEVTLAYRGPEAREGAAWEVSLPVPGCAELPVGGWMEATVVSRVPSVKSHGAAEALLGEYAVGKRLTVRAWRAGDRLALPGGKSRKLQDLFVDAKVPRSERRRVPVVVGEKGQVLWVAGLRVSAAAQGPRGAPRCVRVVWGAEGNGGRAD